MQKNKMNVLVVGNAGYLGGALTDILTSVEKNSKGQYSKELRIEMSHLCVS